MLEVQLAQDRTFLVSPSLFLRYSAAILSTDSGVQETKRISAGCGVIRSAAYICGIYCHSVGARRPAHEGACLRHRVLAGIVEEVHCVPGFSVHHDTDKFART